MQSINIKLAAIIGVYMVSPIAYAGDPLAGIAEELEITPEALMIESVELSGGQCQDWIRKKGWESGENINHKDGSTFTVQIGSAVINAPPGHPNYINARQNAYVKAMLRAKAAIVQSMQETIERELVYNRKEGQFTSEKEADKRNMAAAQEADTAWRGALNKSLKLINAELDQRLVEKGIDPNPNTPEGKEALVKATKEIVNLDAFSDIIRTAAKARMKGVRRIFVAEQVKKGEQGGICVVALASPKTMAMADAIFSGNFSLAPTGRYGKPLDQQIPNHRQQEGLRTLMSSFGTEMIRDENGQFYLLAYAPVGPQD